MNASPDVTPAPLTPAEAGALRCLAGAMLPASTEYGVPAADDERIFADLLQTVPRDLGSVREALRRLDYLAGGSYASLPPALRLGVADELRRMNEPLALLLVALVTRCYYRDDRVMRSLGMDVRPPFPLGFEVATGNLSLLEPVRARGKIWRDSPSD